MLYTQNQAENLEPGHDPKSRERNRCYTPKTNPRTWSRGTTQNLGSETGAIHPKPTRELGAGARPKSRERDRCYTPKTNPRTWCARPAAVSGAQPVPNTHDRPEITGGCGPGRRRQSGRTPAWPAGRPRTRRGAGPGRWPRPDSRLVPAHSTEPASQPSAAATVNRHDVSISKAITPRALPLADDLHGALTLIEAVGRAGHAHLHRGAQTGRGGHQRSHHPVGGHREGSSRARSSGWCPRR